MRLKMLALSIVCVFGIDNGNDLTPEQSAFAIRQLFHRIQEQRNGA